MTKYKVEYKVSPTRWVRYSDKYYKSGSDAKKFLSKRGVKQEGMQYRISKVSKRHVVRRQNLNPFGEFKFFRM